MKRWNVVPACAVAILVDVAVTISAQTGGRRDFDAEYRAAVQGAKDAAGCFERFT